MCLKKGNGIKGCEKMGKQNGSILKKLKSPKFVHKSLSAITVILSIAIVVGINIGAKLLTDKFSLRADLTKNKVFSITEETIKYLSSLDKNIDIIILNTKDKFLANGDYYEQSDSVINEYAKYSDKISIKYISLDENPNIKSEYAEDEISENSIIVKSGDRHKILSAYDIFNIQQSYMGASITSSKAEQAMTSALISVTSENKVKVNMITGFDELEANDFVKMLETNNYEVNTVSMLTDEMNDNIISFIYAPSRDYDDESISKLKNYLVNNENYGRNLIYFINPSQASLPKIENFVKEWGIGVNDGLVFETDISKIFTKDRPFNTICEYEEGSEYSNAIKNKSIPIGMPISRPLEILDSNKAEVLLKFSKSAGIMPSNASESWSPSDQDIKGPIPCMAMSTVKKEDTENKSTLTVVGSVTAVDGNLLSRNSLNNSAYFLNLFNILTKKEDSVNIEPKAIGVKELSINPLQAIVLGIAFAIILPIIVLIAGFVVWLIRRKR